jgi:hypothetical protein
MATTYSGWVKDGRPWHPAECIDSFGTYLRSHGYTVYTLGDDSHLEADTPEDHTPYSHTPWPGSQPYPYVLACDIMPGGDWSLAQLGARIYADKQAGVPGTEFIKYMNWTDSNGDCWHDKWTPGHSRSSSSDRGHIHLSARTDYVHKVTGYKPFAPQQEDDMDVTDLFNDLNRNPGTKNPPGQSGLNKLFRQFPREEVGSLLAPMKAQLAQIAAQQAALAGKDFVDEQAIVTGVLGGLTEEKLTAAIKAAGVTPEAFAAALPPELAQQILDAITARLAGSTSAS